MESLHKNIANNYIPPMKAVSENGKNHSMMQAMAYILLGLTAGMLITTLAVNIISIRKHIKETKNCNTNGTTTTNK